MEELDLDRRPQLTRPVLVASFRGWNDGGQVASMANAFLGRVWHGERFASIDSEQFFDFQSTRPHVTLVEGSVRRIDWPENVFEHARPSGSERDTVLLLGTEPGLRWRTFAGLVSGLAKDLGVELVVTLGALLADVPHTVSLTPSPRAAKALCDRLGTLLDVPLDTSELEEASEAYMQQVSEAVAADEDTAAYVEELEGRVDEIAEESDLPSGDALAAELTRFLRDRERRRDEPQPGPDS